MRKIHGFALGAVAVAALAFLTAQVGGFPSRPRFLSVGINAASTLGPALYVQGSIGNGVASFDGNGVSSFVSFRRSATPVGDIGSGDAIFGGATDDFSLGTRSTGDFVIATGSSIAERFRINDSGIVTIGNPGVFVPTHLVAETATSGAAMRVGDTITISKSAATSRANNAADTNDPDLQITSLPAGHYIADFQVNLNQGGGGARYRLEAPTTSAGLYGVQNCASTITATNGAFDGLVQCAGTLRASGRGASAKLQATGTVAISWAQNTSNAANTTLENDSYLSVTRID